MKKTCLFIFACISCCQIALSQTPAHVPANGLIGWWPLDGNVQDLSGNGHHGTVNGPVPCADRLGNPNAAYDFQGNQTLNIQHHPDLNIAPEYAIALWYLTSADTYPAQEILIKGNNDYTDQPCFLRHHSSTLVGQPTLVYRSGAVVLSNNEYAGLKTNLPPNNQWHFIVVNIHLSKAELYVDNILKDTTNFPGLNSITNSIDLKFGGGYYSFTGKLDDIGFWNRPLSIPEMNALYAGCTLTASASPITALVNTGSIALFQASTNNPSASFQWQSNAGDMGWADVPNNNTYSGANTATLNIQQVKVSNHLQSFRAIATSGSCKDTSNMVSIHLSDTCIISRTDTIHISITDTTHIQDTIHISITDTIHIQVTDTTYLSVIDTLIIPILITGIIPPNNTNILKIFPNPAHSHITVHYGNFSMMNGYTLRINNSIGQQVYSTPISMPSSYIDITSWGGSGMYYVYILDSNGKVAETKKILLQ